MAITDLPLFSMLRTRMQWHQERQRLLAENVSNSDTPSYRPRDLASLGRAKMPVYVWGNGGCSADGTSSRNHLLEIVLEKYADRIGMIFSGHTHRAIEGRLGPCQGYNIGGDYHFKRLLILDWPAGNVEAHVFGSP